MYNKNKNIIDIEDNNMLSLNEKLYQILESISTTGVPTCRDATRLFTLVDHLIFHKCIVKINESDSQQAKYRLTDKGEKMLKNLKK
ncbi:hypothetical protein [Macrococcoides caseolyticum]|nr:hypothetical protein [Macrococcus caseolyticus]